ncbi:MAG: 50S ribosomal protein L17 [Candidatus Saccharimonadales bacterium]
MHRHGYKGRKFGRERDQRAALINGLIIALFENGSITTTLIRAKEIRRYAEKLITHAKKGDLAARRLVIARLNNQKVGSYLVDVVAPQIKRDSGYLRIERAGFRKGDNTEMATISFVDEIVEKAEEPAKKVEEKAAKAAPKAAAKEEKK